MSGAISSLGTSKNTIPTSLNPPPSQSQSNSSSGADNYPQRRSGGFGNFGGGLTSRATPFTGRNNQSSRRQHKGQRRPRLIDEDTIAESVAMQSTSSRKGRTSITHLMTFSLPPRPQHSHQSYHSRNIRKNPSWGLGSGYHAIDKAKYVHANYRFIVNPRGDYHEQAMDADVLLDWSLVLQILVSAQSQSTNCPICLSTPVAPRMAKCGHVFCLPCLIRYMHSTDDTNPVPEKKARWKKCPICWDSVYISETRSVRWFVGQEGEPPREGEDVVLRLLSRRASSTLALPRDGAEALEKADDIPWYFAAEVMDYARVMKGSEDYMRKQYNYEISELRRQEREDELMFGEEATWTKKAVTMILEAQDKLSGIGNPPCALDEPVEKKSKRMPTNFQKGIVTVSDYYHVQHAVKSGQSRPDGSHYSSNQSLVSDQGASNFDTTSYSHSEREQEVEDDTHIHCKSKTQTFKYHGSNDSSFYFYEALLHYYLSPLDIRILKVAFGDYGSFPATILPRVERVSTGHIVDDDLRRRAKYLSHLPHGCEVGFLECDWTDIVASEILTGFSAEIERRRKHNREKEIREEKERVRAEKDEDDKRWAAARRKRSAVTADNVANVQTQSHSLPMEEPERISFSEMALESSSPWGLRSNTGSTFASLASPSTSPVASRTVWGTAAVAPVSPTIPPEPTVPELSNDDGWLQGWEQSLLQEEDLAASIQASSLAEPITAAEPAMLSKRKKKNKKITLMTTNARRGA